MRLPGDKKESIIASLLRVDHAGEYGAVRIYEGQKNAIVDNSEIASQISHMKEQEEVHLDFFNKQLISKRIRPTLMMPLWHQIGYLLGKVTAKAGVKYAMICTKAVEEVIDKHYQSQIDLLEDKFPEEKNLVQSIKKFQQEELEHRDCAAEYINSKSIVEEIIGCFCKMAIGISKRV